jgi:hypothetical protein
MNSLVNSHCRAYAGGKRDVSKLKTKFMEQIDAGTVKADPNQRAVINWLDNYTTNLLVNLHQIKRYKYDF